MDCFAGQRDHLTPIPFLYLRRVKYVPYDRHPLQSQDELRQQIADAVVTIDV